MKKLDKMSLELIIDIIANSLKKSGKAFFYPVMLIFTKEQLYSNKDIKFNTLNDDDFDNIISKCYESIDEYELQNKNSIITGIQTFSSQFIKQKINKS